VILVDDASTDNTYEAITSELSRIKTQIIDEHKNNGWRCIRHTENRRQGGARNTAVKSAHGDYVIFLDEDDYFAPGALHEVAEYLTMHSTLDVLMCDSALDKGKGLYNAFHYRGRNSTKMFTGS